MRFVTTYQPAVQDLKKTLMANWSLIENQPSLKKKFLADFRSYKRGKSLKDVLVRAKCNSKAFDNATQPNKNHIGSPCRSVFDFFSFKQSLSLIIQHLIASTQRFMELTASICEYVESALKESYTVGIRICVSLRKVLFNDLK